MSDPKRKKSVIVITLLNYMMPIKKKIKSSPGQLFLTGDDWNKFM